MNIVQYYVIFFFYKNNFLYLILFLPIFNKINLFLWKNYQKKIKKKSKF